VDYRKLNAATIPNEFPILRQSEILSSLSGVQVLSSLDTLSGFTQLEMDKEEIEKTAFRTHCGLFQFKRMPFGLRNGPSIFQRVMQGILAPYLWIFCLVYIDDIIIYLKTYEDHIHHLGQVLEAMEKLGITLSPVKCHLFYSSILLLGHKVLRLGLSTHHKKVHTILELSRPTKLSQLQTFLGMAVYFSAFIPLRSSLHAGERTVRHARAELMREQQTTTHTHKHLKHTIAHGTCTNASNSGSQGIRKYPNVLYNRISLY
jgi:hypothetical protein